MNVSSTTGSALRSGWAELIQNRKRINGTQAGAGLEATQDSEAGRTTIAFSDPSLDKRFLIKDELFSLEINSKTFYGVEANSALFRQMNQAIFQNQG